MSHNIKLHCYVVIEVKTGQLMPEGVGQVGVYVKAVDHLLKGKGDNNTIGLLICKTKNEVLARYALESSSVPLGISNYDLSKLSPDPKMSDLPSIEEIEKGLNQRK
jgi:hypothetical protein